MSIRSTRLVPAAVLAGVVAVALAGCTGASGGGSASFAGSAGAGGARAAAGTSTGAVKAADKGAADRQVVTSGTLDLVASDPIAAAHAIDAIVTGDGGRVQSLDEQPKGPDRAVPSADLTVRIPAAVFSSTLPTIERRGHVRSVQIHTDDVTSQVVDYGVRIANLRASITRLQTLLARASDTSDLVAIESSLTTRQTDLEQLLAQQKDLADQVSFASLGITIESPAVVHAPKPVSFVTGFSAGLAALWSTAIGVSVGIGALLPWVVVVGILALLAWWGVRLVRRRRRVAPGA